MQLYDTAQSDKGTAKTGTDRHNDELVFMIRRNQAPEQLLIDQVKERKYSPDILLAATSAAP